MNRSALAHAWAHQTKDHGRASNISFDGPRLYSYSTQIGVIINGRAFFNDTTYSSSTSAHQSVARGAASHMDPMVVTERVGRGFRFGPIGSLTMGRVLDECREDFDECLKTAARRRSTGRRVWDLERANSILNRLDALADLPAATRKELMSSTGWKIPPGYRAAVRKMFQRIADVDFDELRAQVQAEERKKREAMERKNAAAREAWINGEGGSCWGAAMALRLNAERQEVETITGAMVPVEDAVLLYRLWSRGASIRGKSIGNYTVTSATPEMVKIGCHTIPAAEIDRVVAPLAEAV